MLYLFDNGLPLFSEVLSIFDIILVCDIVIYVYTDGGVVGPCNHYALIRIDSIEGNGKL